MKRTRLTALLMTLGLGAAGLTPALAVTERAAPVVRLAPGAALQQATLELTRDPSARTASAWRSALLRAAAGDEQAAPAGPEWVFVDDVGDLDGDRRSEVAESRMDGVSVRSGRDGRATFPATFSPPLPPP